MLNRLSFSVDQLIVCILLVVGLVGGGASESSAATLAEQRRELNRASTSLRTAMRMLSAGRSDEAAAAFDQAQTTLQELSNGLDSKLRRNFEWTLEQLSETHAKLTSAGAKPAPLAEITITESSDMPDLGSRGGPPMAEQISFTTAVVPILVAKCGSCHIDRTQGGFSMRSYNALMGANVIEIGAGAESRLIDVIVSGSMPPDGNVVSPDETRKLLRWINQGAKFDGDDAEKSLRELRPGSGAPAAPQPMPKAPKVAVPTPKGNETVSFALDVAPLFSASCVECHRGGNGGAMLDLANFAQLWKGGRSGSMIVPGKPKESLLVQKLKGTAAEGQQMPLNRPAWSAEQIAIIEKWIAEGAAFDGPGLAEELDRVTAVVRAERSTREELNAIRQSEGERAWRLALAGEPAVKVETERFLLLGNLPEQQLQELGRLAEIEADRILKLFAQQEEPLNKSRLTLMIFRNRIDYGEFGTMVERRDLAGSELCHAMFDLVHPYAALAPNPDNPESASRMLAQVTAELWIAGEGQGRLPAWLTSGVGRATAARLWPKDDLVEKWKQQLPSVITGLSSPEAFMTGKLPPATTDVASFGFVDALMQRPGNVLKWARQVGEGKTMEEAAEGVFRRSPKELAELWVASTQRRGR